MKEEMKPERKERIKKIKKLRQEVNELIECDVREHLEENKKENNVYFTIEKGKQIRKYQYDPFVKFSNNDIRISQYIIGEEDLALVKWVMDGKTYFRAIDRIVKITGKGLAIQFGMVKETEEDKIMGYRIKLSFLEEEE